MAAAVAAAAVLVEVLMAVDSAEDVPVDLEAPGPQWAVALVRLWVVDTVRWAAGVCIPGGATAADVWAV